MKEPTEGDVEAMKAITEIRVILGDGGARG